MRVFAKDFFGPSPSLPGEPQPRRSLLARFLSDADGQEDYYLGELARAEAGETVLNLYNNLIHAYLFPDLVVLEDMWDPDLEEDDAEGPRRCTFLTLKEAKQLILDWLDAKQRFWAGKKPN